MMQRVVIYKILFFNKYSLSEVSLYSLVDNNRNSPIDKLESDEAFDCPVDENDCEGDLRCEDLYFSSCGTIFL